MILNYNKEKIKPPKGVYICTENYRINMVHKENIFNSTPFGNALHRIVLDEKGKAVDYEFIEVNEAFEKNIIRKDLKS